MATLEISILGKPVIRQNGQMIPRLVSRKSQALLCYLAYTGQPHSRQALAGLLWSEMTEEKARRNLRVALTRLRGELGDFLVIQRRTLAFNRGRPFHLDVTQFETILKQKEPTLAELKQATDLYRGPFLDDFSLRDALLFEEWVRLQQEHYRQMAMDGLYRLSARQTEAGHFADGIETLGRLLQLEPWMEEAHRQLMLLLAVSGQRSAALAQYETCAAMLDEELGVEPASETTALYQKIREEQLDDLLPHLTVVPAPTPKPLPPPFQVPPLAAHFVGRMESQEAIATTLQIEGETAVQAIVGMGGVGKSALAAHIAAQLQGHFHDGILWANAATSEPMSVLESWSQLFGYDFSRVSDVESMGAAFRSALAEKHVLIVLDDVTSAARIRPLLPSGTYCRVLLTMRDQDLARVLNAEVWPLNELSQENGRLLLSSILGDARVEAEPDAADTICQELQNLPLAVEITAQRLKSRPRRKLADLAQRLRDEKQRLSLLTISDREVRASFAISWETLGSELRRVFALLGLFGGGSFSAEAVAHIAEMDPYLLEDRLYALVALSLLREDGQTRYRQHPLLADFAKEQLSEDIGEVNGRFASYYLHFAQQNQTDYDALRPEWDNLMVAMETAHTHQLHQTVIDFADALNEAWFARARYTEARNAYKIVQQSCQQVDGNATLIDCYLNWALTCIEQNDLDEAEQYLQLGLTLSKSILNEQKIADFYLLFSRVAFEKNNFSHAQKLLKRCEELKGGRDDFVGLSSIYYRRARIFVRQGEYEKAIELSETALGLQEKANNSYGTLKTNYLLTHIYIEEKEYELAKFHCQNAIQLAQQLSRKEDYAMSLDKLATIYRRLGELELAFSNAEKSFKVFQQIGSIKFQGLALYTLSIIKEDLMQFEESLDIALKSLFLLDQIGDEFNGAVISIHVGDVYYQLDNFARSRFYWQKAEQTFNTIGHQQFIGQIQERLETLPT